MKDDDSFPKGDTTKIMLNGWDVLKFITFTKAFFSFLDRAILEAEILLCFAV